MRKIVVAITGASGSIYADLLVRKLQNLRGQIDQIAVVMTEAVPGMYRLLAMLLQLR